MSVEVVLAFSGIDPRSRPIIAGTLELVPSVSGGLLESCDIAVGRESASLLLRAHLSEVPGAAEAVARLSSLVARANGVAIDPRTRGQVPLDPAVTLEATHVTDRAIAPAALAPAIDRAFQALCGDRVEGAGARGSAGKAIELSRRYENVRYDAGRRELSFTSALAFPIGQCLPLAVHPANTDSPVLGTARVARMRRAEDAGRQRGGGFAVTLVPVTEELHAAFALASSGEASISVSPGEAPRPRRKVLLIDDLPERLGAFATAVLSGGFDLTAVSLRLRGIPAFELVATDLVLLTTADPARAEAPLRTCRAAGARDLPVLVASAGEPAHDPLLLQAGADVVVSSAIALGELVDTLRALLGGGLPPVAAPLAIVERGATSGSSDETRT